MRRRSLFCTLLGIAIGLGVWIYLAWTTTKTIALPSGIPVFERSPTQRFGKTMLGEKGVEPRVANVQVVDFDADEKTMC